VSKEFQSRIVLGKSTSCFQLYSSLTLKETSAVVNNVPRELLTNHHYPLMEYKHETSIILLPVTAMLIIYFHSHVTPRSAHRFYIPTELHITNVSIIELRLLIPV